MIDIRHQPTGKELYYGLIKSSIEYVSKVENKP